MGLKAMRGEGRRAQGEAAERQGRARGEPGERAGFYLPTCGSGFSGVCSRRGTVRLVVWKDHSGCCVALRLAVGGGRFYVSTNGSLEAQGPIRRSSQYSRHKITRTWVWGRSEVGCSVPRGMERTGQV